MQCMRRSCINTQEIQEALNFNMNLAAAGDRFAPKAPVPEPAYREDLFSFKLENVQSFYVERTDDEDIVMQLAYDGYVRMKYDITLLNVLNLKFSTS